MINSVHNALSIGPNSHASFILFYLTAAVLQKVIFDESIYSPKYISGHFCSQNLHATSVEKGETTLLSMSI